MTELLTLSIALLTHGQTDALRDGRVESRGINLRHISVNPPPMIYRRMVRNLEFDVAEVAMTTFLCAKALGVPISALPVFSNRDLTLTPLVCGAGTGITKPVDLADKRVAMRSYTETNSTQTRALLRSECDLDTDRVRWVVVEDAHVAQYAEPANVERVEGGDPLAMLASGDVQAALAPRIVPSEGQQLLFSEGEAEEIAVGFWRRTGIYPIGHIVVVKDETLSSHPDVVAPLFQAFKESKRIYLDELNKRSELNARDRQVIRNREIIGSDPLPYGVAANRSDLEGAIEMNLGQHIIPRALEVDSLFAPAGLALE